MNVDIDTAGGSFEVSPYQNKGKEKELAIYHVDNGDKQFIGVLPNTYKDLGFMNECDMDHLETAIRVKCGIAINQIGYI